MRIPAGRSMAMDRDMFGDNNKSLFELDGRTFSSAGEFLHHLRRFFISVKNS